ncbi:hypothetical protein V490_06056 [Pseudogymnoascus sp. VKM F-3557]|nr:hypothetical protein V490_06056 [Pseudogymnoascus sp. VKM F-3557]
MFEKVNIVVIGGSFGGIGVAQNILASIPNVKVTLINTSKDWYFNIAAPRLLNRPNSTPLEKLIYPIKENFFSKYSTAQFEFIQGAAASLNTSAKTVTLSDSRSISYSYLVIATGSHTPAVNSGIPLKQPATDTLSGDIQNAQKRIADASSIVIAGSGAVAIEMAGELAEAYPKKSVTIVSASTRLLPMLGEKASAVALKSLSNLGVKVLFGVRALEKGRNGKKEAIALDNGKVIEADLYIPATGVIPNSNFIPATLLDALGFLIITPEQKVSSPGVSSVYGIGDVTTSPSKMAVAVTQQIAVAVANLKNDIEKTGPRRAFQPGKLTMVVPIGGKAGVAQMGDLGGIVLWSWLVALIKGNYFLGVPFMISGLKKQ